MNINLVPPQELVGIYDKKMMIKKIIIGAIAVGIVVFLCFMVQLFKSTKISNAVKQLEDQYGRYTKLEASIKQLRTDLNSINDESKKLNRILPQQFFWSEKLYELSMVMPENIWFADLAINYSDGYEVQIRGYLHDIEGDSRPIAKLNAFLKELEGHEILKESISSIKLTDMKNEKKNEKKVLGFRLLLNSKESKSEDGD